MSAPKVTDLATSPTEVNALQAPAPAPQYARGFEGMATEPFPEAARRVLAEPINPHDVEIKPDGIVFLPGVQYRRILTRAFGAGGWAIAPRSPARAMGNIVVYHGALFCLGRFVAEAVGECFYREGNANMSYASCIEGAKTDALSRCCKDLGIAAEMWDANWREKWKAQYATSYQAKNRRTGEDETRWKLKNRVSNPHDLMAGAGGVQPAGTASPPTAPAAATETKTTPTTSGAPAPPDTGEAATDAQKARIRDLIKAAAWKAGYVKMWFSSHFQVNTHDARKCIEALSVNQADAVILLLSCDMADYDKLLSEMKARGECT